MVQHHGAIFLQHEQNVFARAFMHLGFLAVNNADVWPPYLGSNVIIQTEIGTTWEQVAVRKTLVMPSCCQRVVNFKAVGYIVYV